MPEIIIDYNIPAIAQYNLNISDINKVVNTAFYRTKYWIII